MELAALVLFVLSIGALVAAQRIAKALVAGSPELGPDQVRLGLKIILLRSAQYLLLGAALLVLVGTDRSWEAWIGRACGFVAVCIGAALAWVIYRRRGQIAGR